MIVVKACGGNMDTEISEIMCEALPVSDLHFWWTFITTLDLEAQARLMLLAIYHIHFILITSHIGSNTVW
jgi:hypothetical protein